LYAPVIVKVLVSLSLILVVNAFCRNLLISVAIGAATLAAWCGHSLTGGIDIAWRCFASADNLLLLVVILQVTWLSAQMSAAGVMDDLVRSVRARISRRASMAVLPAVIGLLPMPGGALFSAPLVEGCDREKTVPALLKVQTNYWFRHVWEYWWPLYPGVLLALDVTRLQVWQFVLLMFPFSFFAIGAGYFFLLRKIGNGDGEENIRENADKAPAFWPLVAPIGVVVLCYTLIQIALPQLATANKYLPLMAGILAAMLFVQFQRRLSLKAWRAVLLSRQTLMMAVLVAAVQVYGAFIESRLPDGTLLVVKMRTELAQWGIPAFLMMMVLPFVSALTTGLTLGFVGASFPIVISLMGDNPPMSAFLAGVALSYSCGFMGLILSPVHICLIVTNEHFKTRLTSSFPRLVLPAVSTVVCGVGYYFLVR
jgi:integral membrane protein (TIGR00529 family)